MNIFLSHSSNDSDAVRELVRAFEGFGRTVWLDLDLVGGEAWWPAILTQIRECDVFVFALSPSSLASDPCSAEFEYARALGLPILPVEIADIPSEERRNYVVFGDQIADYRNPTADSLLALMRAVAEQEAKRKPLPDPLPPEPPALDEYLLRLGAVIRGRDMIPFPTQAAILAELRGALRAERNESVRASTRSLLKALRDRPDSTHAVVTEIDALLAEEQGGGAAAVPPPQGAGAPGAATADPVGPESPIAPLAAAAAVAAAAAAAPADAAAAAPVVPGAVPPPPYSTAPLAPPASVPTAAAYGAAPDSIETAPAMPIPPGWQAGPPDGPSPGAGQQSGGGGGGSGRRLAIILGSIAAALVAVIVLAVILWPKGGEGGEAASVRPSDSSSPTPTVAPDPQECWDGSTADSVADCPDFTGEAALTYAFASEGDAADCEGRDPVAYDEDNPPMSVVRCDWTDVAGTGVWLVEWAEDPADVQSYWADLTTWDAEKRITVGGERVGLSWERTVTLDSGDLGWYKVDAYDGLPMSAEYISLEENGGSEELMREAWNRILMLSVDEVAALPGLPD